MTPVNSLESFAAHLRESILVAAPLSDNTFNRLALHLFELQYERNAAYRELCEARRASPGTIDHWNRVPAAPAQAFKELELSCLAAGERTAVFHSSGTTEQRPSRHFHNAVSLTLYEASLTSWFKASMLRNEDAKLQIMCLTPPALLAPQSSLVHMFETVRRDYGAAGSRFFGSLEEDGAWGLDLAAARDALGDAGRSGRPVAVLGTAFSFVQLLDHLDARGARYNLPEGSRVLETGGYKGRSRSLSRAELHTLISMRLGVPPADIVSEYGMCELSSQAYNGGSGKAGSPFHFPAWARVQLISPETGREAGEGGTGLIRVLDLANVYSVTAVQTEDLGIQRGCGFELIGRRALAEARGCSLMAEL